MKEALWYESLEKEEVLCRLCLHNCRITEGKTGICNVRENRQGKLYSLVDGIFLAETPASAKTPSNAMTIQILYVCVNFILIFDVNYLKF